MRRLLLLSLTTIALWSLWGCLRPSETTKYRFVEPGDPVEITGPVDGSKDKLEAMCNTLASGEIGKVQDITGWIAMPPTHWRVVKADLQKYQDLLAAHPELRK